MAEIKENGYEMRTNDEGEVGFKSALDEASREDSEQRGRQHHSREVFDRYINFQSIINFGFTLQAGWETVGLTLQFALLNGGPASLVYGCIIAGFGCVAIAASLGEMASTDPTVGAQYRWSAKYAPKYKEFFGLIQGWITVFAWIFNVGASLSILGNMVVGLIQFNNPDYVEHGWHVTLIMWACIITPTVANLFLRRVLNSLEAIGGICHVIFWIAVIITLAVTARRSTNTFVWDTIFSGFSGWNNPGIAFNLGLLTVTFPITSFDGIIHMSDEVKQPHQRVPRSMVTSTTMNALMQWAFSITICYCIGDLETESTALLPLVYVYYSATKSHAGAIFLVCMHAFVFIVSLFNIFASVSRLVWAFSRDNGLPFAKVFAWVHPTLQIPLNALLLVGAINFLLALINIGSTTAFNALVSLPTIALYISYLVPISLLLLRKLTGMPVEYGPWRMPKIFGIAVNIWAVIYMVYVITWTPWPQLLPVTGSTMNYSSPILGGIILFALADWFTTGRKRFQVPVSRVYQP